MRLREDRQGIVDAVRDKRFDVRGIECNSNATPDSKVRMRLVCAPHNPIQNPTGAEECVLLARLEWLLMGSDNSRFRNPCPTRQIEVGSGSNQRHTLQNVRGSFATTCPSHSIEACVNALLHLITF